MGNKFSIEAVFTAVDRITGPVSRMQSTMRVFGKNAAGGLKEIDAVTGKIVTGMNGVAVGIAAASAAAAAGLAALAQPGIAFEQQMADLGATSLQTRDQIAPLEAMALELGAATKFSATEVGAAMEAMAKAGFENEQVLSGIGGMVYAAAAAGEELASTTETVSSVMKGMAIDVSESTRVADVLALASVRTNSSISSLGESMSKVASTARQLSVPLEDTVAMVAMLQDVGLDASEAGSATATMLTRLASPTAAVAKQMKKMGVAFQDSAGNMLAPAEVLAQLVKAGDGAGGNMEQVAFFADLVGLRGQKAAVNLKDLFKAGKVQALTAELNNAAGTAKKMADLRMDTFGGDLDVALENIKGVQIELFSLASGPLREVAQGVAKWVDANKALIVANIVDVIKSIATNLPTIVKWLTRVAKFAATWYGFAIAVKVVSGAFAVLNAVLAMNPIALIALALVGLIALIVAFWPEISAFFAMLWEGLKEFGSALLSAIQPGIDAVVAAFVAVKEFFVGLWMLAIEQWVQIFQPLMPFFDSLWNGIKSAASSVGAWFVGLWAGITGGFTTEFNSLVTAAGDIFEKIKAAFNPLTAWFSGLWEGIKTTFTEVVGPVVDLISGFIAVARGAGRGADGAPPPAGGAAAAPQVVTPQARVAAAVSETTNTTNAVVTIKDQTGRAEITKAPRRGSIGLTLQPSGAL